MTAVPAAPGTAGGAQEAATPGRAACDAFWAAIGAGPDGEQPPDAAWNWAHEANARHAWEAAAAAAWAPERDRLNATLAELAKTKDACKLLARVVSDQGRALYAAWIDHQRGDHAAAKETVTLQIEDVLELHTWNGTETGTEWYQRTYDEDDARAAAAGDGA